MKILSQRDSYASHIGGILLFSMLDEDYEAHRQHVDNTLYAARHGRHDTGTIFGNRTDDDEHQFWNRDRRHVHDQILQEFYNRMQQSNAPRAGKALMMGGLGGSGKGHAQQQPHIPIDKDQYFTINPDDIKEYMAANDMIPQLDDLSPMEASGQAHEEASWLAKRLARLAYAEKRNVLWDVTMSGEGSVIKRINEMRKLGYNQIDGAFVDTTPEKARERVLKRHRGDEERYRDLGYTGRELGPLDTNWGDDSTPEVMGGRYVDEELTADQAPHDPNNFWSRNAEVFESLRPEFDNSLLIDGLNEPKVRNHQGTRWAGPQMPVEGDVPAADGNYYYPEWQPQNPEMVGKNRRTLMGPPPTIKLKSPVTGRETVEMRAAARAASVKRALRAIPDWYIMEWEEKRTRRR